MTPETANAIQAIANQEPTLRVQILTSLLEQVYHLAHIKGYGYTVRLTDRYPTVSITTDYHKVNFELHPASFYVEGLQFPEDLDTDASPEDIALTILKALVENRPDFMNLFLLY